MIIYRDIKNRSIFWLLYCTSKKINQIRKKSVIFVLPFINYCLQAIQANQHQIKSSISNRRPRFDISLSDWPRRNFLKFLELLRLRNSLKNRNFSEVCLKDVASGMSRLVSSRWNAERNGMKNGAWYGGLFSITNTCHCFALREKGASINYTVFCFEFF